MTVEDTTSITQPLRWKARWWSPVAGGTYDVRARQWSPELGIFLSIDEFEEHHENTTLWGWPGQSPIRFRDTGWVGATRFRSDDALLTAQYDAVGNPVQMIDPEGTDTLEYDALDRLKKVTRVASGVTTVEDYAYKRLVR